MGGNLIMSHKPPCPFCAGEECAFDKIDQIIMEMRPRRFVSSPTMNGGRSGWVVWLPKFGTVERKSLAEAIKEYIEQTTQAAPKTEL